MTRILPGVIAMATIVVASNILVQFFVGDWLTWGAFTYPFAFLVTDLMNRVHGKEAARKVVFFGFIVGIICSFIGTRVMVELAPDFVVPAVTLRVAIGSATAFLVAQLIDVAIFDRLRDGSWWRAPLASTLVGSTVDTALFFFIAFSAAAGGLLGVDHNTEFFNEVVPTPFGADLTRWVGTAGVDWCVKVAIALLALIPFRIIVGRMVARTA
ncbi:queuosine precursor transporter [Yoonia sp. SS1-5]|uniref:Probable queuosine precursor transporter n=1 Tax=Yoonia rhodophyticola TaxID=3137370 RepID=A0AAN0ME66_9RHOB